MNINKHCFNRSIHDNFSDQLTLYLNNASRSPLPLSHQQILKDYLQQWNDGTHDPYYYNFDHADQFKQEVAKFLNCSSDRISIQFNVAQSFSAILYGLNWNPGDEIILIENDYPSVTLPFQTLKNVSIQWIKPDNGILTPSHIKHSLSAKTKAICLSWVSYETGCIHNISEISEICQKYDIKLLVDGTQALGVIPIDLTNIHVDFFTASLYKWCFCPQGTALSIFSNHLLSELSPISAGVFSQANRNLDYRPPKPAKTAQKFEFGNLNILGIMLGNATFKWFNELGISIINNTLSSLSQSIIQLLESNGYDLAIQYPSDHSSGIVSFYHPTPKSFMQTLFAHNGAATFRNGVIRLSPGIYQNQSTMDALRVIL